MSLKPHRVPFTIGSLLALHAAEDAAAERGDTTDAHRLANEGSTYFARFVAHAPTTLPEVIEALRLAFYVSQCGNLEPYDREAVESPIREAVRFLEANETIGATQEVRFALHLAVEPDNGKRDPIPDGVDVDLITVLRNVLTYLDGWRFT
ncbi:hypothetical protein [Beijerinckia sp. L45]|uniref:hypothetical protein n=1 Tax=Beijerinckia sp. L45 TaxID=1641855 RepID=UPI00131B538A|nr:hypothetical protein [Beijerinckia sp. L45]